jgi:hypothetical protein
MNMAFVNERITPANKKQYRVPEFEQLIVCSHFSGPATCTIDHERNISLMCFAHRLGDDHQSTGWYGWLLNWHGHELWVEMNRLEFGGEAGEPGWSRWELRRIGGLRAREGLIVLGDRRHLPPELEPHRDEILKDLHDAFEAHKGLDGIYSRHTTYKLTLDIPEGV